MKKRIVCAVMALILCFSMSSVSFAAGSGYGDVPDDHWAAESIHRATELGIFQGVNANTFGVGQAISRAAFVTALVRLFGWETENPVRATFTDVQRGQWYYSAVETAVKNGAVTVSGKTFRPNAALTRSDMAAMIIRALGYASLAGSVSTYQSPFTDVTVNKGFITMAYDMGIVSGVGSGKFNPKGTATREQAATILVRVYDRLAAENQMLSDVGTRTAVKVETPAPVDGAELPTTPLEPVLELYDTLRRLKESGYDMSNAVLCLTAGGVRTTVSTQDGKILSTDQLSADEVEEVLNQDNVRTYYSQRYESAYCVCEPNDYQVVTMWYQTGESIAVKLQLARMFGVTDYVMQ